MVVPWPAKKLWVRSVCKILQAAHSPHRLNRVLTLGELQKAWDALFPQEYTTGKFSDYAQLAGWCKKVGWEYRVLQGGQGGAWELDIPHLSEEHRVLILIANTSTDEEQGVWGLGGGCGNRGRGNIGHSEVSDKK